MVSTLTVIDSLGGTATVKETGTVTPLLAYPFMPWGYMGVGGKPFLTVSPVGTINAATVTVINNGADYGPDTVVNGTQTVTSGLQEAINAAPVTTSGGVPEGGWVVGVGNFTLGTTIAIPVSLGLRLDLNMVTYTPTTGDVFQIGSNYASLGKIVLGGPRISIDVLTGSVTGTPTWTSGGANGFHIYQMIGAELNIGTVRNFQAAGVFFDNADSSSSYDAAGNNFIRIGTATSNGVGFMCHSNAPSGSFFGSNDIFIGDAISNYVGVCIDATPATSGDFTYLNSDSVNNRFHFTAEGSESVGGPTDGCDTFINCNYSDFTINTTQLNVRGGHNNIRVNGDSTTITNYGQPVRYNYIVYEGHLQLGWELTTPNLPGTIGSSHVVQNTNDQAIEVLLPFSSSGSQYGVHVVDIDSTDKALPQDPAVLTLLPGEEIYFATTVPASWLWKGITAS